MKQTSAKPFAGRVVSIRDAALGDIIPTRQIIPTLSRDKTIIPTGGLRIARVVAFVRAYVYHGIPVHVRDGAFLAHLPLRLATVGFEFRCRELEIEVVEDRGGAGNRSRVFCIGTAKLGALNGVGAGGVGSVGELNVGHDFCAVGVDGMDICPICSAGGDDKGFAQRETGTEYEERFGIHGGYKIGVGIGFGYIVGAVETQSEREL